MEEIDQRRGGALISVAGALLALLGCSRAVLGLSWLGLGALLGHLEARR